MTNLLREKIQIEIGRLSVSSRVRCVNWVPREVCSCLDDANLDFALWPQQIFEQVEQILHWVQQNAAKEKLAKIDLDFFSK